MDMRSAATDALDRAIDFIASPSGTRLRTSLAAGVAVGAPVLFRTPIIRRHPLMRALDLVGGAAALVVLAERLRDWEPRSRVRAW